MSGFYTADGDMKPPKPLGALSKAGRSSQIVVSSEGFSNDHFRTTSMSNQGPMNNSTLRVSKKIPPNKNTGSEPGVPWSASDYPCRETFTTSNEVRNRTVASQPTQPRRAAVDGAGSTVKLGYKEAEGKAPYMTMSMDQFQDPLLGARKAGPTSKPPPKFPAPPGAVNPITGVDKQRGAVFESYDPEKTCARKTHEIIYKHYNQSGSNFRIKDEQTTKYDHIKGYTIARRTNPNPEAVQNFPRPPLSSLGAVRPPVKTDRRTTPMMNKMQQLHPLN